MKLEITIRPMGTSRIGSGEPPEFTHLPAPILRTRYQGSLIPVIPGSTLKGIMRKAASKFFDVISERVGINVKIRPPDSVQPKELKKHYEETGGTDISLSLFGCPDYRMAKIRISDALPIDVEEVKKNIVSLPGVGIDREKNTAAEGRLFIQEKLGLGLKFKCTLATMEELTEEELLFLLETLKQVPYIGLGSGSTPFSITVQVKESPEGGFSEKACKILSELERGIV
jgi:CRISPR/Cas system CSM-associated protein Csm3 (group 7 of RAMP superfamily)